MFWNVKRLFSNMDYIEIKFLITTTYILSKIALSFAHETSDQLTLLKYEIDIVCYRLRFVDSMFYFQGPIPIYIPLHDFNQMVESKRDNYLTRYIARHYLDEKSLFPETEKQLWTWLKEKQEKADMPKLILMLDGYNEVVGDKAHLLSAIRKDWASQLGMDGIQILISSQMGPDFSWAQGFEQYQMQPLDNEKIATYLKRQPR